jgi:hypothetical protein
MTTVQERSIRMEIKSIRQELKDLSNREERQSKKYQSLIRRLKILESRRVNMIVKRYREERYSLLHC